GDACIFVGYSTQSRAYRVFNKRIRILVETIHVYFDELPQMASDHVSSDPFPQCPTTALEDDSLSPGPQSQENVSHTADTVTTSNELDLLFSPMFDELLNGTTSVVLKSFTVTTADDPNKCQHQHTTQSTSTTVVVDTSPLIIQATPETTCQAPTQGPIFTATENINQAEAITKNAQVEDDEFINIFSIPVPKRGETSSRHVDSSNMHTFYQQHPSEHRWTKDRPLEQVIGNPSQSIRTRCQLKIDGELYMFALTMSQTKIKNIKEAMADSAWIETMQEEIHHFKRLCVWELVDRPLCKNVINMKWLWKNKHDEENTVICNKARLVAKDIIKRKELISKSHLHPLLGWKLSGYSLDIVHATCYCARYQAKPTEKHLTAVKLIFRYLKDTINMGLWYPKDIGFELTAFLDSDHVGCLDSYKSTSGGIQFLGGDKLVSWSSKKQVCTLMSSAEAEYLSLSACCAQVLWLRTQLTDYGFHFDRIPMYCDSKEAIAISCNPV
nr:uncharacterized mitochondrial protein AtMg00810-like [Tanacetum cinerariifolium]